MTRVSRAVEKGETQGFMKVLVDAQTNQKDDKLAVHLCRHSPVNGFRHFTSRCCKKSKWKFVRM
jgi:hypothetical protein